MKKKIIALTVAAAMCSTALLAGCGGEPQASSTSMITPDVSNKIEDESSSTSNVSKTSTSLLSSKPVNDEYSNFSIRDSVIAIPPSFHKVDESNEEITIAETDGFGMITISVLDLPSAVGVPELQQTILDRLSDNSTGALYHGNDAVEGIPFFWVAFNVTRDSIPYSFLDCHFSIDDGNAMLLISYMQSAYVEDRAKAYDTITDILKHSQIR